MKHIGVLFTEAENAMIAELGVYAIWLLKHGKSLDPRNLGVRRIKLAFRRWRRYGTEHSALPALRLFAAIDAFCRRGRGFEPVSNNYNRAWAELVATRRNLL